MRISSKPRWRYFLVAFVLVFFNLGPLQAQNANYSPELSQPTQKPAFASAPTYQDPFYSGNVTTSVPNQNPNYHPQSGNIQPYLSPAYSPPPYTPAQNTPAQNYSNPGPAYQPKNESQPSFAPNQPNNSASPSHHDQAVDLTNQAYRLSKAGNSEQAIVLLKEALALDPSSSIAHLNMSVALIALKRYDEALTESATVLRLNPNEEKGYLNYLAAAIGANQMQDALRVGQEYLERFPNGQNRTTLTNEIFAVTQEIDRRSKVHGLMAPPGAPDNYLFLVTPYGKRRWPYSFMPIKVFIYPGQNYRGFLPGYQSTLISAFLTWQNASKGLLRFIPVNDPAQANIECRWTDSSQNLKLAAEAGDTQMFADRKNNIYHVIITLLTCRPDSTNEQLTLTLMRQVSLHEIGHALGIDGHSDSAQDVMYCATDPNVERAEISQRDLNTLLLIYQ